MKRILTIFLMLVCALTIWAQSINVSSFKLLENDLDANTAGTIEKDQNGEVAALIKVVTTQTGFTFDGGALGVVKTIQKPGEIWVYVPRGLKKITISHPQLGVLRDYYLPIAVASARTYEMVLLTGTVETNVRQARTSQYVVFQLTPSNAVVELNGELLQTDGGTATKMMKFGTYNYRVQAPNYLPEAGNITVNDSKNKHVINIALKPNFASVTLKVDGDAEILVNGERKGTGSWTGNLGAGTYEFQTRKQGHRSITVTRDIIVSSQPQTITLQAPTPIFGEADINSSPAMADIYIDGNKVGQTPQLVSDLIIGQHEVKISKPGYKESISSISIKENELTSHSVRLEKVLTAKPDNQESIKPNSSVLPAKKTRYSDFFPLWGMNLGKTTWDEASSLGYNVELFGGGPRRNVTVNKITFWDHEGVGAFTSLYWVDFFHDFPEEWKIMGFSWENSYDQWLSVLRNLGFTINVKDAPIVKEYSGRNTLSATFEAVSSDGLLKFEYQFSYGEDGHLTTSPKSLYSIKIDYMGEVSKVSNKIKTPTQKEITKTPQNRAETNTNDLRDLIKSPLGCPTTNVKTLTYENFKQYLDYNCANWKYSTINDYDYFVHLDSRKGLNYKYHNVTPIYASANFRKNDGIITQYVYTFGVWDSKAKVKNAAEILESELSRVAGVKLQNENKIKYNGEYFCKGCYYDGKHIIISALESLSKYELMFRVIANSDN